MPDLITGRNADGSSPPPQQILFMQLAAMAELIDRALSQLGKADNGDYYAVLPEDNAREIRDILRSLANLFKDRKLS